MSVGLQLSVHRPHAPWMRTLAALKLAAAMLLPEGGASAQARKDYAQTPTPKAVARRMLEIGGASPNDVVADLGSGDGRIPILAAQEFGARAIGVELDKDLHTTALENAHRAGVGARVTLINGDLFEAALTDVTLLTIYLPQSLTLQLRRRILNDMRPGTRVVSHEFGMGAWLPDRAESVEGRTIKAWVVPARVNGPWRLETAGETMDLAFRQSFQEVSGTVLLNGLRTPLLGAHLRGTMIRFSIAPPGSAARHFQGVVGSDAMTAADSSAEAPGAVAGWRAVRQ